MKLAATVYCVSLACGCGFYGDAAFEISGQAGYVDGTPAGLCAIQLIDDETNVALEDRAVDGSGFLEDFTVSPRSGSFRATVQCGTASGVSRKFSLDEAKGGSATIDLGRVVVTPR